MAVADHRRAWRWRGMTRRSTMSAGTTRRPSLPGCRAVRPRLSPADRGGMGGTRRAPARRAAIGGASSRVRRLANCAGCGGTQDPRAPLPVDTFPAKPLRPLRDARRRRAMGAGLLVPELQQCSRRWFGPAVAELHEAGAARRVVPRRDRRYHADRREATTMRRFAIWRTASGSRATSTELDARLLRRRRRRSRSART